MSTIKNYLDKPYARTMIPTTPSGFHAEILEFPGCFAQGETVEEAYANLEKAAESWIETCLEQGQTVPEPSTTLSFSGRIVLRLPKMVHQQAAKLAERDNCSLNSFLVSAVSTKVGAEDFYNVIADRLEKRIMEAAVAWQQRFLFVDQTRVRDTMIRRVQFKQIENTSNRMR